MRSTLSQVSNHCSGSALLAFPKLGWTKSLFLGDAKSHTGEIMRTPISSAAEGTKIYKKNAFLPLITASAFAFSAT